MSTATARKVQRVGLFGGSFNPPHRGHEELVEALLARALLDSVLVVPVYAHPFGKDLAPFAARMEMCRIAFAPFPAVRISAIEQELGGRSYTVRTLEALRRELPGDEIYLVIGADALRDVDHWRDFERVKSLARLLVVPRQGEPREEAIDMPAPMEISSREIRRRIRAGEPITGLVSPGVEGYITRAGVYRGDDEPNPQIGDER
jgi:nicotinate-nucleotide adenylyltransferase